MSGQDDALFPSPDDGGTAAVLLQLAGLGERVQALEDLLLDEPDLRRLHGRSRRRSGGCWKATTAPRPSSGSPRGSTRCTGRPTATSPGSCPPAGPSTRSACSSSTGCANCTACCTCGHAGPRATLAGQAEWTIRQLPAAADLMAAEARACEHSRARLNGARPVSAELAARRTAAAAVLADYQRRAAIADVAERATWGARLARHASRLSWPRPARVTSG